MTRIMFLRSAPHVRTSGNPPVKRRRAASRRLLLDLAGKCHIRTLAGDAWLGTPLLHCETLRNILQCEIARPCELWFEKLDSTRSYDLAQVLSRCASKVHA